MAKKESVKGTWTKAEITLLKKMFPNTVTTTVAAKIGRPLENVKNKASRMGLKKTKKHLKSIGRG
jgi:hypothetical protein